MDCSPSSTDGSVYQEDTSELKPDRKLTDDATEVKPDRKLKCYLCNEYFPDGSVLLQHRQTAHGPKRNHECSLCKKKFKIKENFDKHMLSHEANHQCGQCDGIFESASSLASHENTAHPKDDSFVCSHCGETFFHKSSLLLHLTKYHSNDTNNLFKCPKCEKTFPRKYNLKRHYEIHRRPNTCVRCSLANQFSSKRGENVEHQDILDLSCAYCNAAFNRKRHLLYHIQKRHMVQEPVMKSYQCQKCNKTFTEKCCLKRHKKSVHGRRGTYKCGQCDKVFSYPSNLKRHESTIHPVKISCGKNFFTFAKRLFECPACQKTFSREDILRKHVQRLHLSPQDRPFVCAHCEERFSSKYSLLVHIKRRHGERTMNSRIFCCLCKKSCDTCLRAQEHYRDDHNINLEVENLHFSTFEDFKEWKLKLEGTTVCRYVTTKTFKCDTHSRFVYMCHRSGVYESKTADRKRKVKGSGLKKLNGYCPAGMKVIRRSGESSYHVSFLKTHVGHSVEDEMELRHVYLNEEERRYLASKISTGIPLPKILEDCRNSAQESGLHRLSMLKLQDLHNISAAYNLKNIYSKSLPKDALSIDVFLENNADAVLFYKPQSQPDLKCGVFGEDDLVLIIMTDLQQNILQQHAHKIVAIYGAHEMNSCTVLLHSMLVLDNENEGIAVAFALCNRDDEIFIETFLTCVKERVGMIKTNVLMTDMHEAYYDNWIKVMHPPEHRLLCMWHVKKAWWQNLHLISSKEKQKNVRQQLNVLSRELDENSFCEKLNEFINNREPELETFIDYFVHSYVPCVKSWAYCYRRNASVFNSLHVETFHKVMKYLLGGGKKIKSLMHCLRTLADYISLKENDFKIKKGRGRTASKLQQLKRTHMYAMKQLEQIAVPVEMVSDKKWRIGCFKNSNVMYTIDKIMSPKCPVEEGTCHLLCVDCETCLHQYKCTCPDSIVHNNMCEHIHVLCTFLRNSVSEIPDDSPAQAADYEFVTYTPSLSVVTTEEQYEYVDESQTEETCQELETETEAQADTVVTVCEYPDEKCDVAEHVTKNNLLDETQKLVDEFKCLIEEKARSVNDINLLRSKFLDLLRDQ